LPVNSNQTSVLYGDALAVIGVGGRRADNPQKMTRHRPKLSRQVYQGSFWRKVGGLGW